MSALLFAIAVTCLFGLIYFHWSRRHLYAAANKFKAHPTLLTLPIIGNAHLFLGKTEDIFGKINLAIQSIGKEPIKFWLGPNLLILIKNPIYLEKIMSSSKCAYKHELYGFVEKFLGEGLVSASGLKPKHKLHRRIIQPLLDLKFVESCLDIMQDHVDICINKLEEFVDKEPFDVHEVTTKCFMDTIGDVILGTKINSQRFGLTKFCQASIDMYIIGFRRIIKPWLHFDFVYNMLPDKAKSDNIIANLNDFIQEVIIESWKRRKVLKGENEHFTPIVDKLAKFIEENPYEMDNEDFMNHLMTLFTAAADTLTIVSSFAILCFGMYPEYQEKAVEEIRDVVGQTPRHLTITEINRLTYLDMCLKDIHRLFPIAPYILRRCLEDYHLDKWIIPKEAAIVIPIFNIHREETYWERPNHFYPDHFLPDATKNRPAYAYMPFSAGPRGCIGKILANIELKLFLCNLLLKFEIVADGKVPDVKLRSDISIRPKKGYMCKIKRRIWR